MTYKIKHLLNIFQHRKCMECTKIPFSRSMWAFFATKWQKKDASYISLLCQSWKNLSIMAFLYFLDTTKSVTRLNGGYMIHLLSCTMTRYLMFMMYD